MSVAHKHKVKHRLRSELVREDDNEGTAARTRPFSFDEIMDRRKKKKEKFDVSEVALDKDVKRTFDNSEYERSPKKYSNAAHAGLKTNLKDIKMVRDGKKDNGKDVIEEKTKKVKVEKHHVSKTRSKTTSTKNFDEKVGGVKDDHKGYVRKREEMSPVREEYESEKRTRNVKRPDKLADIIAGYAEKEKERSKTSSVMKRDLERSASELSERKERKESVELNMKKESRSKRRRSWSREHDKDKTKSSTTISVTVQKHSTREQHGDTPSHNYRKDRSEKQVSDLDGNRITSNGSSSHNNRHGGSTSGLGGYSPRKRRTEAAVKTPSPTHLLPEKKSVGWDLPPPGAITSNSIPFDTQPSEQVVASDIVASIPSPALKVITGIFSNASIDSIQLTQATRPMRSLYVENLPASASEKSLRECFNNFLLCSGVNHIKGTHPCISCIVNKEKSQAIVEFLTPEDASAALAFDGRSFFGSFLKVRRPRDFIEVTTGISERATDTVGSISDTVKDSPYKIFIGEIPNAISSEMLMEIAGVFGPLKAYHVEINTELKASFAFLEYVDQSVTLKACAGLNGIKLGGQILTAVQARPNASLLEDGGTPFYGIPEHAKPLLEKPTRVLNLWNMIDSEGLQSLSEPEVDGLLEDIRLECSRSGAVKSVHIVWNANCPKTALDNTQSSGIEQDLSDMEKELTTMEFKDAKFDVDESHDADKIMEDNNIDAAETLVGRIVKHSQEFEPGSVLVEYRREETACMAAHSLHGRSFDGRIVTVAYVALDVYQAKYPKSS